MNTYIIANKRKVGVWDKGPREQKAQGNGVKSPGGGGGQNAQTEILFGQSRAKRPHMGQKTWNMGQNAYCFYNWSISVFFHKLIHILPIELHLWSLNIIMPD